MSTNWSRPELPLFSISITDEGQVTRIGLSGELDLSNADQLRRALACPSVAGAHVVLDLSELEFIDSSGIGARAEARQAARLNGSSLVISAPTPQVRRVLQMTGMLDRFAVVEEGWQGPSYSAAMEAPSMNSSTSMSGPT